MALVLANRVQETTATTGTGTITLAGAVSGYQSFAAIGNANTTYYTITSGTAWEVGIGTYTSAGTTLSRDTVLSSSAGGTTKITLAGTSTVFADYPAEKSVNQDASGNVGIGTSSPGYKLVVSAASNTNPIAVISGSTKGIRLGADANGGIIEGVDNTGAASYQPMTLGGADIRLTTSSTERMRITSTGAVGIGTTAPADTFTVNGTIGGASSLYLGASLNNSNSIEVGNGRTGSNYAYIDLIGDITYTDFGLRLIRNNSGANTTSQLAHRGTGELYISTVDAAAITFQTSNTDRMRIDSSGNVGIGTSSPGAKLDVAGGVNNTGAFRSISGTIDAIFGAAQFASGVVGIGSVSNHPITFNTNLTENMRITTAGNVGIGTTTPGGKLHTQLATSFSWGSNWGTGTAVFGGASLSTGALGLSYNDTDGAGIGAIAPGVAWKNINFYSNQLIFNTNGATERMRIDSSGNVGIGTSAPASLLHVKRGSNATENYPTGTWATRVINATDATTENGLLVGNRWASDTSTIFEAGSIYGGGSAWAPYYKITGIGTHIWGTGSTGTECFRITTTGGITSSALADAVGYKGLPQNSQTASYTLALTDMGKMINTTTGGVVIPANGSVAFPIGSAISIYNNSASSQTISITTDTIYLAGTATTGSRTLAQRGLATCVKVASTTWVVSGAGVT